MYCAASDTRAAPQSLRSLMKKHLVDQPSQQHIFVTNPINWEQYEDARGYRWELRYFRGAHFTVSRSHTANASGYPYRLTTVRGGNGRDPRVLLGKFKSLQAAIARIEEIENNTDELRLWILNDENMYNKIKNTHVNRSMLFGLFARTVKNKEIHNVSLPRIDWNQLARDLQK